MKHLELVVSSKLESMSFSTPVRQQIIQQQGGQAITQGWEDPRKGDAMMVNQHEGNHTDNPEDGLFVSRPLHLKSHAEQAKTALERGDVDEAEYHVASATLIARRCSPLERLDVADELEIARRLLNGS